MTTTSRERRPRSTEEDDPFHPYKEYLPSDPDEVTQLLGVCVSFAARMGWIKWPGGTEWLMHVVNNGGPSAFREQMEWELSAAIETPLTEAVTPEWLAQPDDSLDPDLIDVDKRRVLRSLYRRVAQAEDAGLIGVGDCPADTPLDSISYTVTRAREAPGPKRRPYSTRTPLPRTPSPARRSKGSGN